MLIAILVTATLAAQAVKSADATQVTVSAPSAIVEIDAGKLKGEIVRLAWSPEARELYLQTAETSGLNIRLRHYRVGLDGTPPASIPEEPGWAALYWSGKSAQSAPGMSSLKIDIDQQQERVSATSAPSGGSMARGDLPGSAGNAGAGAGMGLEDAARAAGQSQTATTVTLRLKGHVIGEFVNTAVVPGLAFSWGPSGTGLIAFVNQDRRIVILDDQGRTQTCAELKSAALPAWTNDGQQLAYLEKTGKKKFTLRVAQVTVPTQ
jgi:hypothetical protein